MDLEFEQLQDLVLLVFREAAGLEHNKGRVRCFSGFNRDEISVRGQSDFMVRKAVEGLADRRLIKKIDYDGYEIAAKGLSHLERALKVDSSFLRRARARVEWNGSEFAYGYDVLFLELPEGEEIPASDRVVTLNHNHSDYQQAVEALDKVLEEFRNDHRLDNELGPLKDAHLKVLEGGRKALEDKEISVENGQNWIVAPLKWIAEKFADGALKVLAVKALEAIAKLF